jgi:hypothetical protein
MSSKKKSILRMTADEAIEISETKTYAFERTLAVIRSMVDGEIRTAAKLGKRSVKYLVPLTVFGHEHYDINAMGKALARQLYEDKFTVTGTCSLITISWGPEPEKEPCCAPLPSSMKQSTTPQIRVPIPRKR